MPSFILPGTKNSFQSVIFIENIVTKSTFHLFFHANKSQQEDKKPGVASGLAPLQNSLRGHTLTFNQFKHLK